MNFIMNFITIFNLPFFVAQINLLYLQTAQLFFINSILILAGNIINLHYSLASSDFISVLLISYFSSS